MSAKKPWSLAKRQVGFGKQTAFTLVELLVVIAIISVLAGMMLPVLANAIGAARDVACVNNFRQMYLAANAYSDDFGGWILPGTAGSSNKPWYGLLSGTAYHMSTDYGLNYPESFKCPSESVGFGPYASGLYYYTHYGINVWLAGNFHVLYYNKPHKRSQVKMPSVAIFLSDSARTYSYAVEFGHFVNYTRHRKRQAGYVLYMSGVAVATREGELDDGSADFKKGF